ncbi:MAG: hypothetical protein Q8N88_01105, partial [Nanoarchaeota archaeon]|nr:hypothetical protein [Nanoarchaeota archaeon]
SGSLEEFGKQLRIMVAYSGNVSLEDVENYIVGSYIYPPSLNKRNLPSPIESIYSTYENLKIVARFLDIGKKHSNAILLAGANSWGIFHAVEGKIPSRLVELGLEQKKFEAMSDIDFLITCQDFDQLGIVLEDYIQEGLIDIRERVRLNLFKELLDSGQAEVFSVRAHYGGTEESIHFVFNKTISKVIENSQERDEEGVGFVRNFRPNIPGNLKKHGAYPTGDILGITKRMFDPQLKEVYGEDGKEVMGYLSRMTVGGFVKLNDQDSYFLGLLSCYLLTEPIILFDRDRTLHNDIVALRARIKVILGDKLPRFIPREERMASTVLQRIKESF